MGFFFLWRVLLSGKDLVLRKGWQIAFDKVLMSLCRSVTYINSLVTRIKWIASLWAQQWKKKKKRLQCLFFWMYTITGSIHIYRNSSVKVYRNCFHCHVMLNSNNFLSSVEHKMCISDDDFKNYANISGLVLYYTIYSLEPFNVASESINQWAELENQIFPQMKWTKTALKRIIQDFHIDFDGFPKNLRMWTTNHRTWISNSSRYLTY